MATAVVPDARPVVPHIHDGPKVSAHQGRAHLPHVPDSHPKNPRSATGDFLEGRKRPLHGLDNQNQRDSKQSQTGQALKDAGEHRYR